MRSGNEYAVRVCYKFLFPFKPECPDYHWTICETTFTICLVFPVGSSNGTAHFRCEWNVLRPLSLQMRKWSNFFKRSTDYWTPIFVEKSIKNELQIFDIAFSYPQTWYSSWSMVNKFSRHLGSKIRFICCSWKHETTEQVRCSHVCGFSVVWSSHVESNVNGYSYNTGCGLSPDFFLVTLLVVQFIIKLVIIMNVP